jgi:hypothetical protein
MIRKFLKVKDQHLINGRRKSERLTGMEAKIVTALLDDGSLSGSDLTERIWGLEEKSSRLHTHIHNINNKLARIQTRIGCFKFSYRLMRSTI